MDNEDSEISEEKLVKKIIYCHDVLGYGFRRISDMLLEKYGIEIGKDAIFRRYHKHKKSKTAAFAEQDEELAELDELERKAQEKAEIARTKSERKRRIAALLVQEADASFERRQELFENKKALLDFAEKVLPTINPTLWLRLKKVCKMFELDVENALREAIGPQTEYEENRRETLDEDEEYTLDQHLCQCLEDWLVEQEEEIVEVLVTIEGRKRDEHFKMQIPSKVLKHQ